LRGWCFAHTIDVDIFTPKTTDVIDFLNSKFQTGAKYSTLNTTRAAISLISSYDINKDGLLSRFMKGIFKQCPTKPRYVTTWDVSPVLDYLDKQHPITRLDLKVASQKLATLLALTTAQRLQTLALINIDNISVAASNISIKITENIKTSRPGFFQPDLILPFFKDRPGLCVASVVLDFVNITKELRGHNIKNLFIITKKPFRAASAQTVGHWIKDTLQKAGIDTSQFTAYSIKHAAVSTAFGGLV